MSMLPAGVAGDEPTWLAPSAAPGLVAETSEVHKEQPRTTTPGINTFPPSGPERTAASSEYIHFDNVLPFCGMGYLTLSCYTMFPDFIGFVFRDTCCCFRIETALFKPGRTADSRFILLNLLLEFSDLRLMCKSQNQIFCVDCRFAVPPDDRDAPCIVNFCFITCFFKNQKMCKFFRNGGELAREAL